MIICIQVKLRELILQLADQNDQITAKLVKAHTSATLQGIGKELKHLVANGRLKKFGVTRGAYYALAYKAAGKPQEVALSLSNQNLQEHEVFMDIRKGNHIFDGLSDNLQSILDYAFSEMLNNAIEHSGTQKIHINWKKTDHHIEFLIADTGIGVFRSIRDKKGLPDEMSAIQELLKGKTTTMPQAHSGQGIFFTSRIADVFTLSSYGKRLVRDNRLGDIFVENSDSKKRGTQVHFLVAIDTDQHLSDLFQKYSYQDYEFDTTDIHIKMYQYGTVHISRSQARRVLTNLEKFTRIIFDFQGVPTVGQAFADEVFRVWQKKHPAKIIEYRNANENVDFMIRRALTER